jgi:hypothetical protein
MMAGEMTGLLVTPSTSRSGSPADGRRPLVIGAAVAGAAAAGTVLVGCMAAALVAWFSTDQGSHGTTKDALRIGSDAWLLAHGATLDVGVAVVTLVPLGLTVLCGYVCFRLGRWAAATSLAEDLRTLGLAVLVFAAVYALVSLVVALLASVPAAEPHLGRAFAGGFLVAALGGGSGLTTGSGHLDALLRRLPEAARAVLHGAAVAALATFVAGGLLVVVALVLDLGEGANVLTALHADGSAGAFMTLLVAGFAPNAALFGSSYLVGPGFAVGTGTVVSTGDVSLGPVPAFPLLAALPGDGPAPWWALLFLGVPVLLGGLAGWSATRAHPSTGYDAAALRGLGAGAGGGVLLGIAFALAGGAVGPGRMADVGPAVVASALAAVVSLGLGSTIGAVLTHWRLGPAPDGTEPTVDLNTLGTGAASDEADAEEPTVSLAPRLLSRLRPRRD